MATRRDGGEGGRAEMMAELVFGPDPFAMPGEGSVFPDEGSARQAWQRWRVDAWRSPDLDPGAAPAGAEFDGVLTGVGRWSDAERKRAALASVAAFRRSHRNAAAEIGQPLERYEASLRADATYDEDDDAEA